MHFNFLSLEAEFDYRAKFANAVLKLIYQKNNGDLGKSIIEAKPIFEYFRELIRNIYELINTQIPLYAYFELVEYGADNYDFSEKEYQEAIESAKQACIIYYS